MGDFLGMNYADAIAARTSPSGGVLIEGESGNADSWEFLARGDRRPAPPGARRLGADDLSDFIFTSGTTGSEAVMTAHGQNIKVFDVWGRCVGLQPGGRYLIIMPFFHSFGYKSGWLACIIHGAPALPEPVFDVGPVLERIQREKITVMPGSPTIYQSMLTFPEREKYDTSSLRLAVTGGAAVPVELVHRMRTELGFRDVITAYGLTESSGTVTACELGDDDETIATTCGKPIPTPRPSASARQGGPAGEPGEIWTRGYHVMRGYWGDEAETAKAIDGDGWLHTGDIGVFDERGYLRITDRIKDMFIMGGFNVYPAEVENLLFQHEGIAAAAVIGVPDDRMGEVGMAFVVPTPGASLDAEALVAWSRDNMANYKVPRFFEVVDELPANASGKVLKNDLRDRAKAILA